MKDWLCEMSECEQYRWVLRRKVNAQSRLIKPILFIMLNPSTADADNDDATIKKCMMFAEREGATMLTVVNLFALRATDPNELKKAEDPEGPGNDYRIEEEIEKHACGLIVIAWGAHPFAGVRAQYFLNNFNGVFYCLGVNKNGSPKHPLYLSKNTPLMKYKRIK